MDVHTGLGAPGRDTLLVERATSGSGGKSAASIFAGANVELIGAAPAGADGAAAAAGGNVGAGCVGPLKPSRGPPYYF